MRGISLFVFLLTIGSVWAYRAAAQFDAKTADPIGISKQPPTDPKLPHVAVEGGTMVPYSAVIPGTNVRFEMVPIPGGVFTMGGRTGKSEESPQVQVKIDPMWVGKFEVTQAEYNQYMRMHQLFKRFVREGIRKVTPENAARAVTAPTELYEVSFRAEVGEGPDLPAIGMTQFAAKQYTKWLSGLTGLQYRLPTEAEWEYACRAGSSTAFHFVDSTEQLDRYVWYANNSGEQLHAVGSKLPNSLGLYDMHGNVREWVVDGYTASGYSSLADRPSPLHFLDAIQWPTRPDQRVLRGGSWSDKPDEIRCAARFSSDDKEMNSSDPELPTSIWWYTDDPSRTIGFRIVRSYSPLGDEVIRKFYDPDHPEIIDALQDMLDYHRAVQGVVDPSLAGFIQGGQAR